MTNIQKIIEQLKQLKGTRFASLVYQNKEGEVSRYTLLLGADYETAKGKDLAKLLILQPRLSGFALEACNELIASYKLQAGENPAYTCQGVYEETGIKGLKVHKETGDFHLIGYSVSRVVLKAVSYKATKSAQKTIEKNALRKLGRLGKIRQFKLNAEKLALATINGKTLVID